MSHRKVLLTGHTGYVGQILHKLLTNANYTVVTAGRSTISDLFLDLLHFETSDLNSNTLLQFDAVIHLAASNEVYCKSSPSQAHLLTVAGTKALFEWTSLLHINKFIYISSFHVFGANSGILDESTTPQPVSDYGRNHLLAEQYLLSRSSETNTKVLIIRPSNLIGELSKSSSFNRWSLAPFDFCRQAYLSHKIILNSDGSQVRNWVSISHLFAVIHQFLSYKKNATIHAAGQSMTVLNFAYAISHEFDVLFGTNVRIITNRNSSIIQESSKSFTSQIFSPAPFPALRPFVDSVVSYLTEIFSQP